MRISNEKLLIALANEGMSNKITLTDAMNCEWWNFDCWKR